MKVSQDVIEKKKKERKRVDKCTGIHYDMDGNKKITHLPEDIRS